MSTDLVGPIVTAAGGGILVVVFQQTWKGISTWQDRRKDVDVQDHELLHELADAMMDKPAGLFTAGSKGTITQVRELTVVVGQLNGRMSDQDAKLDEIIKRLPPA